MPSLEAAKLDGTTSSIHIDKRTDQCPICHTKISPLFHYGLVFSNSRAQIFYQCTGATCKKGFISLYEYIRNFGYRYVSSTLA